MSKWIKAAVADEGFSGHSDSRELSRGRTLSLFQPLMGRGFAGRPRIRLLAGLGGVLLFTALCGVALAYYGTDSNLAVGYSPVQPIEFSHKLHAGDLGLDCRFCHFTVEQSAFAALPPTEICMKCHSKVRTDSIKLLPVRATYAENQPISWVRVHKLADYVYFDHSVHVAGGVGCSTCHGRVNQMQRVEQVQSLSMGWCIDCHRNPAPFLRSPADVTRMNWKPAALFPGMQVASPTFSGRRIEPPTHCSGCHR